MVGSSARQRLRAQFVHPVGAARLLTRLGKEERAEHMFVFPGALRTIFTSPVGAFTDGRNEPRTTPNLKKRLACNLKRCEKGSGFP